MPNEMITELIGDEAAAILTKIRSVLTELHEEAAALDPAGEIAKNAKLVREHVDEFFLLVVIGEVKSGKSSFINSLLGEKVQAEGPLPLTDRIWVLRHGERPSERIRDEFVYEKMHPNRLLKLFNMVDTPGTNSIIQRHGEITLSFIPKADLTLFVTSIDRPFSESERIFLNYVNATWRKKVIFVLTKIDTRDEADVEPVVEFIKSNCKRFLDFEPRVFPISAKYAQQARETGNAELLTKSGLPALEDFLASSLAEQERLQLKLSSPAEAGLALLDQLDALARERRALLERDFQSLSDLDSQIVQAATELKERYNGYIVKLYDLLREFERRGKNFLETVIRVQNFGLLRDHDAFQRRFEKEVVADLKEEIQRVMHEATDWLMKEQIALFERSMRYLAERLVIEKYRDRVASRPPHEHSFEYHRDQLVSSMQATFRREIDRFDIVGECNRVMELAYRGVLRQIGVQTGAVGIGALLVTVLTTAAMMVTSVVAAGVLFAAGFIIVPRTKRRAIQEFSMKVDALIREFRRSICMEFDGEIDSCAGRLRGAYEPYLQFYRAETSVLGKSDEHRKELRLQLLTLIDSVRALKRVDAPAPPAC
jgi:small GTP-binding protein